MTRRLVGMTEVSEHTGPVADSIGLIGNWKRPGPVYELPFSCLYGRKIKNLITAGRCISADQNAVGTVRIMGCCLHQGEAAGYAAACCIKGNLLPSHLDGTQLKKELI